MSRYDFSPDGNLRYRSYVNNNSHAHRQKLVAVYALYFYFRYKIVVVHHIFHDAE